MVKPFRYGIGYRKEESKRYLINVLSLSCAWRNLVLANYRIDPKVLEPYLPRHTALDLY